MSDTTTTDGERIEPKNLFTRVSEGDTLLFGDLETPATVYRHVTSDDRDGQIITMKPVTERWDETLEYEREHGYHPKAAKLEPGDLVDGELTGREFLVVRGPRGAAYILTQKWSKHGGRWSAKVSLFRRTRKPRNVWEWERYVDPIRVGHADVNRDAFDAGNDEMPWVRHTDVDGRAIWHDVLLGVPSEYDETDAGEDVTVPSETLEDVSEGDVVDINDLPSMTVTSVEDNTDSVLADGVSLTLEDEWGTTYLVRTISEKLKAYVMSEEIREDVHSCDVVR